MIQVGTVIIAPSDIPSKTEWDIFIDGVNERRLKAMQKAGVDIFVYDEYTWKIFKEKKRQKS